MKVVGKIVSILLIVIGLVVMTYSVYTMNQWRLVQNEDFEVGVVRNYEGVEDTLKQAEIEALDEKQGIHGERGIIEEQIINVEQRTFEEEIMVEKQNLAEQIRAAIAEKVAIDQNIKRADYQDGMMVISIPTLDVRASIMDGTSTSQLKLGPGLYEMSPLVNQNGGNVLIAGHRTTYGKWFRHVDQLETGDSIVIEFNYTKYIYEVERVFVVAHNDWSVTEAQGYSALTLTACHPLGSAIQRIVVRAKLVRTVNNN